MLQDIATNRNYIFSYKIYHFGRDTLSNCIEAQTNYDYDDQLSLLEL